MSEGQKKIKEAYDKVLAIYIQGFERIEKILTNNNKKDNDKN